MPRHTLGVDHRQPGLLPGRARLGGADATCSRSSSRSTIECVLLGEHETKLGAVETWAARQGLRGSVPAAPRPDRRGPRLPAELRRREGRGRHAEARPGWTCPSWCRPTRTTSEQLHVERRRDAFCGKVSVCNNLQPVRHPVQPDRAAHGAVDLAGVPRRTPDIPRRVPRRQRAARARGSARSARGRTRSTPRATARSSCRRPASASARSISRRSSRARGA